MLQWFARQDNLTLVMDRVPAGTFTYSDNRSYTPTEAIDLLNSVLLTKNFTLLRRDRMLTVLELTGEIPIELIPRVKLEELPARGRFELVSVLFPLGKRPVDAVTNEVQPYLSNYGRAVPLAQSRQLLVIETAGKMQTINLLIASVPEPAPPPQPPKPEPPPVPVFASYPLGNLDPQATLATIKKLIPSEQITVDDKTRVLSAFLIPAQQTAIQTAITQMQQDTMESPGLESMSYRVTDIEAESLQKQILAIAPSALVSFDKVNSKVIVTAPVQDQAKVAKLLEVLGSPTTSQNMAVKSFSLAPAQADAVTLALKTMLPNAQVLSNEVSGIVIVRGSTADLQLADEVVTTYKIKPAESILQLRVFPLEQAVPVAWLTQVTKAFPDANLWLDAEQKQLLSLATTEEHARLEAMLPELKKLLPRMEKRTIAIYPLTPLQLERWPLVESAAKTIIPNATLSPPTEKNELIAWGSPADHEQLKSLLEELQQQSAADTKVRWPKVYPLKVQQPSLVVELLQTRFSDAKIFFADGELTVWADQAGQQTRIYQLNRGTGRGFGFVLSEMLPEATIYGSRETSVIMATASPEDHQKIQAMIDEYNNASGGEEKTVVIALKKVPADSVADAIQQIDDEIRISADDEGNTIVVTTSTAKLQLVESIVKQMEESLSANVTTKSYSLKEADPTALQRALRTSFPRATLSADDTNGSLYVTATEAEHTQIAELIASTNQSLKRKPALKTFMLKHSNAGEVANSLEEAFGRRSSVGVSFDENQQLALVEETLKQFAPPDRELEIFYLRNSDPNTVQTAISSLFADEPYATSPTVNKDEANSQVLVRGTQEQLVLIRQLLQKMGEPLTERANSAPRGRVRTVVLQRDSELLLEQLRKIWPQVRSNPLEIVRVPNESAPPPPSAKPLDDQQPPPRGPNPDPIQDPPAQKESEPALKQTPPQPAADKAQATATDTPPVVVIPEDRQWTIASEDTAALDQFEALLAAGMRQPVLPAASTGNYSVYMLRHADAEELQQVFTSLFRRGATGSSSGFSSSSLLRTTFVADTRINALVMYGGNADRMVIEELLSVLDSDQLINQLQLEQPIIISVENTDAQRVVDVLQDVYENQLTSDGGRRSATDGFGKHPQATGYSFECPICRNERLFWRSRIGCMP